MIPFVVGAIYHALMPSELGRTMFDIETPFAAAEHYINDIAMLQLKRFSNTSGDVDAPGGVEHDVWLSSIT